jgi:hypothetical protein
MTLRDEPVRLHVGPLYLFFQFTILILSSYPSSSSMSDDHKRICSRPESQGSQWLSRPVDGSATSLHFLFSISPSPHSTHGPCQLPSSSTCDPWRRTSSRRAASALASLRALLLQTDDGSFGGCGRRHRWEGGGGGVGYAVVVSRSASGRAGCCSAPRAPARPSC